MVILVLVLVLDAVRGRRGKGWRGLENCGGLGATSLSTVFLNRLQICFFLKRKNSKLEKDCGNAK